MNFKRLALLGGYAARGVANVIALTPARLDLMVTLFAGPLCQRDLATKLCVHDSVVSRLVHALMKLGLVRREIPIADRRFRLVSLTAHGRAEYARLTDCEWWMDPDGRYDCQSLGENTWLSFWNEKLEGMKLAYLAQIYDSDCADNPPHVEPPYAAIRLHHRLGCLVEPIDVPDEDVAAACLAPPPRPPRLQRGLAPDPRSTRLLREFEAARDAVVRADPWRNYRAIQSAN